jgi:hypothetical protein
MNNSDIWTPAMWLRALAVLALLPGANAHALDWSGVPAKEITLFYPGQASWEWVLTQNDHSGAKKFREGKNCLACHGGEEKDMGATIVSGKKVEPQPIAGKPGALVLTVQAAHDAERLYLKLSWSGGTSTGRKLDPDHAARVTVALDDGSVKEAARAGCWGSCHDDATGMASAPAGKRITKYLVGSRTKVTRQGGGENFKSSAELQQLLGDGMFLEYWQAQLNPGQPAKAVDGYILDKRHVNDSPAVSADATLEGNRWSVVLSRSLKAVGAGHKDIVAGKIYTLGFAVHDDFSNQRRHDVSFEHTLVLDQGDAEIVAVRK